MNSFPKKRNVLEAKEKKMASQQELLELQQKLMTASRDLNEVQLKININERNKKRAELTNAELSELAPETSVYKSTGEHFRLRSICFPSCWKSAQRPSLSVGRMFLSAPLGDIKDEITKYIAQCDDNLSNLDVSKTGFVCTIPRSPHLFSFL